jgi:hypothetical protein
MDKGKIKLSPEQEAELSRRLQNYLEGKTKFKSWVAVKRNIYAHAQVLKTKV